MRTRITFFQSLLKTRDVAPVVPMWHQGVSSSLGSLAHLAHLGQRHQMAQDSEACMAPLERPRLEEGPTAHPQLWGEASLSHPGHRVAGLQTRTQRKYRVSQTSLFHKAPRKNRHAPESRQVPTDICRTRGTRPLEDSRLLPRLPQCPDLQRCFSAELPGCPLAFWLCVEVCVLNSMSHSQQPPPGQPGFLGAGDPDRTESKLSTEMPLEHDVRGL